MQQKFRFRHLRRFGSRFGSTSKARAHISLGPSRSDALDRRRHLLHIHMAEGLVGPQLHGIAVILAEHLQKSGAT